MIGVDRVVYFFKKVSPKVVERLTKQLHKPKPIKSPFFLKSLLEGLNLKLLKEDSILL